MGPGELDRIAGNDKLFVRRHDEEGHGRIFGADDLLLASGLVLFRCELCTEEFKVTADGITDLNAVFSDSGRKDHSIQSAHGGGIGADVLFDMVDEHIQGKLSPLITFGGSPFDVTEVAADAGDTEYTAFLMKDVAHGLRIEAFLFHDGKDNDGVHVSAAGPHDDTGDRTETEGRVDGTAPIDGRNGTPVAEVTGDNLE